VCALRPLAFPRPTAYRSFPVCKELSRRPKEGQRTMPRVHQLELTWPSPRIVNTSLEPSPAWKRLKPTAAAGPFADITFATNPVAMYERGARGEGRGDTAQQASGGLIGLQDVSQQRVLASRCFAIAGRWKQNCIARRSRVVARRVHVPSYTSKASLQTIPYLVSGTWATYEHTHVVVCLR